MIYSIQLLRDKHGPRYRSKECDSCAVCNYDACPKECDECNGCAYDACPQILSGEDQEDSACARCCVSFAIDWLPSEVDIIVPNR